MFSSARCQYLARLFSKNLLAVTSLNVRSGAVVRSRDPETSTKLATLEIPNSLTNIFIPTPDPGECPTSKSLLPVLRVNGTELARKVSNGARTVSPYPSTCNSLSVYNRNPLALWCVITTDSGY